MKTRRAALPKVLRSRMLAVEEKATGRIRVGFDHRRQRSWGHEAVQGRKLVVGDALLWKLVQRTGKKKRHRDRTVA